jgi:hypothetical protein
MENENNNSTLCNMTKAGSVKYRLTAPQHDQKIQC